MPAARSVSGAAQAYARTAPSGLQAADASVHAGCAPTAAAAKLPGAPVLITALDAKGSAEMTTDQVGELKSTCRFLPAVWIGLLLVVGR